MNSIVFLCGFVLGYGVRLLYILATGRDILICSPRTEVFRLRREADRIAETINAWNQNHVKEGKQ